MLIGGAGPKRTLRIVAKYADWCNLNNASLADCQNSLEILRQHCQTVGREYAEILKTFSNDCVAVASTRAEAERVQKASFFERVGPITGTPDEVAAQIQAYVDLGISHFILRFADFPHTGGAKLFMQEVMPKFN